MATNSKRNPHQQKTSSSSEESTVTKAKDALRGVGTVDTGDTFDKAWERVYGSKEYRPSWVGKLENGPGGRRKLPPPPKAFKPKPIKEEVKKQVPKLIEKPKERRVSSKHTNGIPEQYRTKNTPAPLLIDGKIAPKEKELEKWRNDIESDEIDADGNPVYNKVVRKTNIKGWMDNNSYWQPAKEQSQTSPQLPLKPKKRERVAPPKNQVIHTAKYDLAAKYENTVRNEDLKLGATEIPKEKELKHWGDGLDIPDDELVVQDYTSKGPDGDKMSQNKGLDGPKGMRSMRVSHPQPSSKNKKWNAVLKTADVPTFFTKNTFWES